MQLGATFVAGNGLPSSFMNKKQAETLPKMLPGVVCTQWVRCGRPSCRCAQGKLHGPYHYRFWRQAGRLRKVYVSSAELDRVQGQCETRRNWRRELRESREYLRCMVAILRECTSP